MRTISKRTQYGMKAMISLGRRYREGPILISVLAREESIPLKFLEAILLELSRNRLVASRRGKFGGYSLARPAAEISFAEAIRVVDGPLALAPCVSPGLGFRKCEDCPDLAACTLREALLRARDATAQVLETYSLADAVAGVRAPQLAAI